MSRGHHGEPTEPKEEHGGHLASEQLLDVHLAEYTALTARGTNYLTLSVAVFSIIPLYLGFVGVVWSDFAKKPHGVSVLVWASLIVIQGVSLFAVQFEYDQYQIVFYIETTLRHRVHKFVQTSNFWEYENLLRVERKSRRFATWWEHSAGVGMLILLFITVAVFQRFVGLSWSDAWGITPALVLAIILFIKSREARDKRNAWERAQTGFPI
jgi:hypothetical protein